MNIQWARTLLASLRDAGLDEVIASPGSRSTPLILAACDLGMSIRVIIDEREAAFFAVGKARRTGRPCAVLCTSGTAGAHYLPAVIEASHARVPVIAITADRPPELQGCGAPQTIDQRDLMSSHTRLYLDLGTPEPTIPALRAVRRKACQALATSLGPMPGPVHVNVPARKPLEPTAGDADIAELVDSVLSEPLPRRVPATTMPDPDVVSEIATACANRRRGLLVCGPRASGANVAGVLALAAKTGYPVLAEVTSQLRFTGSADSGQVCGAFDRALADDEFARAMTPELIIEIGEPPTSGAYVRYLERHDDCPRYVLGAGSWPDPHSTAVIAHDPDGSLPAAISLALTTPTPQDSSWTPAWREACDPARLESTLSPEQRLVCAAVASLPAGSLLALGNSLAVRSADLAKAPPNPVEVWCQRGVNGIDGLISGAAGAASAGDGPAALLIGDVSFAHSIGGLAVARTTRCPLAIVVIDNGGGRIFENLPIADLDAARPDFERLWLTPPDINFEAAALAYGISHQRADSPQRLADAVGHALERPGCTVVVAEVHG